MRRKKYLLIVNRIFKVEDEYGHPKYQSERLSFQVFYDDYSVAKAARNKKVEDICEKCHAPYPQRYRSCGSSLIRTGNDKSFQVILRTVSISDEHISRLSV